MMNFNELLGHVKEADAVIADFDKVTHVIFHVISVRMLSHIQVDARHDITEDGPYIVVRRRVNSSSRSKTRVRTNKIYIRRSLIELGLSLLGKPEFTTEINKSLASDDALLKILYDEFKERKISTAFATAESAKKSIELIGSSASAATVDDLKSIIERNTAIVGAFEAKLEALLASLSVVCHTRSNTLTLYKASALNTNPAGFRKLPDDYAWLYKYASDED
jgi:hypothetical protein